MDLSSTKKSGPGTQFVDRYGQNVILRNNGFSPQVSLGQMHFRTIGVTWIFQRIFEGPPGYAYDFFLHYGGFIKVFFGAAAITYS